MRISNILSHLIAAKSDVRLEQPWFLLSKVVIALKAKKSPAGIIDIQM